MPGVAACRHRTGGVLPLVLSIVGRRRPEAAGPERSLQKEHAPGEPGMALRSWLLVEVNVHSESKRRAAGDLDNQPRIGKTGGSKKPSWTFGALFGLRYLEFLHSTPDEVGIASSKYFRWFCRKLSTLKRRGKCPAHLELASMASAAWPVSSSSTSLAGRLSWPISRESHLPVSLSASEPIKPYIPSQQFGTKNLGQLIGSLRLHDGSQQ